MPARVGKQSVVRFARWANAISQDSLAKKLGKSRMFVSRLERGEPARLTPAIARKISETLEVPEKDLFENE